MRNHGVLRATLLEANGTAWPPFKEGRHEFIEEAIPVLMQRHGEGEPALLERRLRIVLQLSCGSIIHACQQPRAAAADEPRIR